MTLMVGILIYITNTKVFDSNNENSVMYKFNTIADHLKQITKGQYEYMISMFIVMGIAFIPLGFILGIFLTLFTIEDRKIRKQIYKQNIMKQLIDEKIAYLESKK